MRAPSRPDPFELSRESLGDGRTQVIEVRGEVDASNAPRLEGAVRDAIESNGSAIVVDLSACPFIDSLGLMVLLRSHQNIAQRHDGNGRMAVVCDGEVLLRLFEMTSVNRVLQIVPDRGQALAVIHGGAAGGE